MSGDTNGTFWKWNNMQRLTGLLDTFSFLVSKFWIGLFTQLKNQRLNEIENQLSFRSRDKLVPFKKNIIGSV